jgi:ABC-type transporter Mla subunit MlaD
MTEEKKFYDALAKLDAIMKGTLNRKDKVRSDSLNSIVDQLIAEQQQAVAEKVKEHLRQLVKAKADFDRVMKEEEDKLKALREKKMKEIVSSVQKLQSMIEDVSKVEDSYKSTVEAISKEQPEDNTEN